MTPPTRKITDTPDAHRREQHAAVPGGRGGDGTGASDGSNDVDIVQPPGYGGEERGAVDPRFGGGRSYTDALSPDAFLSLGSMEGLFDAIVAPAAAAVETVPRRHDFRAGYALAGGVAALAFGLHWLPLAPFRVTDPDGAVRHPISAAILAILVGLVLRNTLALPDSIKAGCKRVVKKGIPLAIVLMGAGLNLNFVASLGVAVLLVIVVCIAAAVAAGYYAARLFGLRSKTAMLLGVGTGICGNSAIVAVAPLIDADDDDLVLSVGAVNLFGLLAMLVWPLVGARLNLSSEAFGLWSGTTIHAVPQVVAAGFAFSPDAGTLATLVKLVRVTALAPLVFILAVFHARHHAAQGRDPGAGTDRPLTVHYGRLVPWFVWGFVALAALNTLGLIPTLSFRPSGLLFSSASSTSVSVGSVLTWGGKILLTLAMAAIGLEVSIRQLAGVGPRILLAGLLSTAVLAVISLAVIGLVL